MEHSASLHLPRLQKKGAVKAAPQVWPLRRGSIVVVFLTGSIRLVLLA